MLSKKKKNLRVVFLILLLKEIKEIIFQPDIKSVLRCS